MYEIHPDLLWLGHAFDIREPRPLFDAGISAVIDVAIEERVAQLPRQLLYLRFPINDGGGNAPFILRLAVQSLVDLLHSDTRTIIACSAGMSRSPTIAAFALAYHLNITPEAALERIATIKTMEINSLLWSDIAAVFPNVRKPT